MVLMGFYVHPDTTISLLLPPLSPSSSSTSFKLGCLRALQAVLKGSHESKLTNHVKELITTLSERDLIKNENIEVLLEVSKCVFETINKATMDPDSQFQLFYILLNLQSAHATEKVPGFVQLKTMVYYYSY